MSGIRADEVIDLYFILDCNFTVGKCLKHSILIVSKFKLASHFINKRFFVCLFLIEIKSVTEYFKILRVKELVA